MSDYPLVLAAESNTATPVATFNTTAAVLAASDAAFALATFAVKLAGGVVGSVAGLATAPLALVARGAADRTVGDAADEPIATPQLAAEPQLIHEVPTPDVPMAPVAEAVRKLEE